MIIATILALGAESKDASSTKTCFGDAVTNAVRALMPPQRTNSATASLTPRAIFLRVCR